MQLTDHILSREKILTTFAIAKKVTPKNMKTVAEMFKSNKMSKDKAQEILRHLIEEETKTAILNDKVPGLIINGAKNDKSDKKLIMELTYFASIISKKMKEKKIDKYYCCYIINTIASMLQLTEEDFTEFHSRYKKPDDGDELPA